MKQFLFLSFSAVISGCASHPVLPTTKDIEVSRKNPSSSCTEIGPVEGRTITMQGTSEEALEDMKKDAAQKGANYVRMETMGVYAKAVRGTGFYCE